MSTFHVQESEISELDRARVEFEDALNEFSFQRADNILQAVESHNRSSLLNDELDKRLSSAGSAFEVANSTSDFDGIGYLLLRFLYLLDKGADPQTPAARVLIICCLIFSTQRWELYPDQRDALYGRLDKLISSEEFDSNMELYGGTALSHLVGIFCYCTKSDIVDGGGCSFRRGGWPEIIMTRLLDKGADPGPDVRLSREVQMGKERRVPMMCRRFRAVYEEWRN